MAAPPEHSTAISQFLGAAPLDPKSPLTAEVLTQLFLLGLTAAEIGALFRRDPGQIRRIARKWGLDGRSLRAGAVSMAVLTPTLAAEFLEEVGGSRRRGPEHLTLGAPARCRWRCASCAFEWEATVSNRALRGSGCPSCARRRNRETALTTRAKTPALALVRPELAAEFVENETVPQRDASSTPAGSHDRIRWRCRAGHEWVASAKQRVSHRTNCPGCRPGFRSSRLEYDVAELITVATGLGVQVSHEEPRQDRADVERIDLWIQELDMLIDLDPERWHRGEAARRRDARKLRRLASRNYVRARSLQLGALDVPLPPGSRARQVILSGSADGDPELWLAALVPILREGSAQTSTPLTLPRAAKAQALGRAARRWADRHHEPRARSLASEHPHLATEFVAVVDRPGLTAADIAPAGDDLVLWRCTACLHEWQTKTKNRTRLGTGCPPCRYQQGGRLAARAAPGNSFADRNPQLVDQFIANRTHPGVGPREFKPNSTDSCEWRCPRCDATWVTSPQSRNRRPDGGCGCGRRRSGN
ncbi:zinc-ribbon domain-containing protein [Blastococcus saxobsidens]|uniref:Putative zinc ribbon protein n=1 Tax=Blastococcus saxobsidens TaxID=138336 RepID=A0A4Q7Y2U5_9ACTN|nr:zinc-ribbon domain-containing protein [Blastococcus saxobsidens]RZU30391.1 putative zinc ribbon protein [Blastococcus saxobsidens]